jgi:hypothetical protein
LEQGHIDKRYRDQRVSGSTKREQEALVILLKLELAVP